ncbi:MAG: hypothetical protein AB7D06_11290 [Pedobacter sp.]
MTGKKHYQFSVDAVQNIVGRVLKLVVLEILVGVAIHGFIPENFMVGIVGKGVKLGTVLAFTMRVTALFIGVAGPGILVVGYLFNRII